MSYGGQQNRTDWYDRQPVSRNPFYNAAGVAPHGSIARWTYTAPTNKKFNVQLFNAGLLRDAAAGAVAQSYCYMRYTPNGGAFSAGCISTLLSNTVGASDSIVLGGATVILPGDTIEGVTADSSTGGSLYYFVNMQGLEFDA